LAKEQKQHQTKRASSKLQATLLEQGVIFHLRISRYKGKRMRKLGADESFLSELKPTPEEIAYVKKQGKTRLEDRCRNAVTLKNCGDNLIMYFRQCLESSELGNIWKLLLVRA
jgi:hypothetical protein